MKKLLILLCLMLIPVLTACSSSEKPKSGETDTVSPSVEPTKEISKEVTATPEPTPTEVIAADPTATPEPTPTDVPTEEPTAVPEVSPTDEPDPTTEPDITEEPAPTEIPDSNPDVTPEPTDEPDITEEPAPTEIPDSDPEVTPEPTGEPIVVAEGPEVSELPDMDTVFKTYYDYVRSCMDEPEYSKFDTMRFGLAYIDNDELPELLVVDDFYHSCGVKIIFYNNGEPKQVGEVGEYGGFSYFKQENRIISFYMNMGISETSLMHVDKDLNLVADITFYQSDDENVTKINNEEVDAETFNQKYEEATASENGNLLYVRYDDMLQYYPYVCMPELIDAFSMMNDELKDPNYTAFSGYFNSNMQKLCGTWELVNANIDTEQYYISYNLNGENDGYSILSEATFSREYGLGVWLSAYKNDDALDGLCMTQYEMKPIYFPTGISEGIDYGWGIQGYQSYTTEKDWQFYACVNDQDQLIILISRYRDGELDDFGNPLSDNIMLTYERQPETDDQ